MLTTGMHPDLCERADPKALKESRIQCCALIFQQCVFDVRTWCCLSWSTGCDINFQFSVE